MKEIVAELTEVRPGRQLFVREWLLGVEANNNHNDEDETPGALAGTTGLADVQLFCLHGSCASESQFHLLIRALDYLLMYGPSKLRVKCVLFDMMGCGQSPVVNEWEAYSGHELQQDLGAIVEHRTLPNLPLYFLSHSYGPNLLVHWLNSDASKGKLSMEQVRGFMFLGASIRVNPSHPVPDGGHPIFRLPLWILQILQRKLTQEFLSRAIHPSNDEVHKECAKGKDNDMFMVKAFYRQTKWATSEELVEAVRDTPVIHIHGVNDGILPIGWGQHLVNQLSPDKTQFVPLEGASHMIMLEKPAEVARKLYDFVVSHQSVNK